MSKFKKILNIFNRKQRIELIWLTFLILVDAVMELMGVSIIVPFINLITNPEKLTENNLIYITMKSLQLDERGLIVLFCVIIALIYIVKNMILVYVINRQFRFTYCGQRDMGNKFMKLYLDEDYEFHLQHNSAELMRDVSNDTSMFYSTVLSYLQLFTEAFICVVLIAYLLYKDVMITLGVAGVLGLVFLLFLKRYRRQLVLLGNDRRHYTYKMTQAMQQAFGGIKEIKIAGTEDSFEREFEAANGRFTDAMCRNLFLNSLPKPVMESLCIFAVMMIIVIQLLIGADTADFAPVLAVFAVAAFRLLPSANKVASYVANIMHNGVVVDSMEKRVLDAENMQDKGTTDINAKEITFEKEISIDHVTYSYENSDENVIEDVSLVIPKNASVAFIGKSGAGKTTFVDIILGLLKISKGRVLVDGQDISFSLDSWKRKIGYIPQNIYMLDDSIRNNITFGKSCYTDEEVWHAVSEAQLADFIKGLPAGLDTVIGEQGARLSGGQRQRIGIARALIRKPELLVLDEATSALDKDTEQAVMDSVEHLHGKLTMIIIAHRLSTIEKCDSVYEVGNGKVVKK